MQSEIKPHKFDKKTSTDNKIILSILANLNNNHNESTKKTVNEILLFIVKKDKKKLDKLITTLPDEFTHIRSLIWKINFKYNENFRLP